MRSFESREDYLEAILVLQNEKGAVRSIDIAANVLYTVSVRQILYDFTSIKQGSS